MRCAVLAAALGCVAVPVLAQDAANGKLLYKTYCQVCHTVDPSTSVAPFNQIMTAANNPAQILVAAQVEPPRDSRRLLDVSYAAMGNSESCA